MKGYYFKWNKS